MPSSCELSLSAKPKEALETNEKKNVAKPTEEARAEFNCFLNLHISHIPVMLKLLLLPYESSPLADHIRY